MILCMAMYKAHSQCPDSTELKITATLYTQENGLPANNLIAYSKDTLGYRYFLGVDGRWGRYDGVNFTVKHKQKLADLEPKAFYKDDSTKIDPGYLREVQVKYGKDDSATIYAVTDSHIALAGPGTLLYEFIPDQQERRVIDLMDFIHGINPSTLHINALEYYNHYILIGTSNAGLLILNPCTNTMQHFQYEKQNSNSSLTNAVIWIAADNENVIWMQTEAGLIKLEVDHQFIRTYMPSSVKRDGVCNDCNNIRSILSMDDNSLLICSLEGIYTFDLASAKFNYFLSPVDRKPVWNNIPVSAATKEENGNVFISSWRNEGILLIQPAQKRLINIFRDNDVPAFEYMRCLFYDSHHVLWAGTTEGFLRISNLDAFQKNGFSGKISFSDHFPEETTYSTPFKGSVFVIAEDHKDNIWMGTTNGLYVYNQATQTLDHFIHASDNDQSISDDEIRSIWVSPDGDVWIGTNSGGLNLYNDVSRTFTAFTTENGLPNNSIYTILEDHNGFLWLGTNGGLCRFNKTDYSVRNYTPRDGIQNYEFNTNAVSVTPGGIFCFGGRTGLNIFHPDSMNITFKPPKAVITKFKIFDKEFPVTDTVMHLPYYENAFTFDFAVLNYYRSGDNQYAYMMEGADKDWIPSGNRTYTSYNNLTPGTYTFKVRAANYTGAWNDNAASMSFIIHPAWYNTWLFRVFIVLLLVTGAYAFYRYRLSELLKLQAIRNRIASDLHDEIGSTLSSISLSSTIIQSRLKGNQPEVDKLLKQVSTNTDKMMEALSDIVWAINTRNDRFDNVVNRMRAFAIEILEPANIDFQMNVADDITGIHLDMQQRKNLYLIFKEAVNNISKYANGKNVRMDIRLQGSKILFLRISDDGKGFDVPVHGTEEISLSGNGIRNMKKRAEELGGEITIDSDHGEGTTVQLRFPVSK